MTPSPALVFTDGLLGSNFAKTAHGVLRGSQRFTPLAVIDRDHAGRDAGEVMDGRPLGVPVVASLTEYLANPEATRPESFVVGVAFPGGYLPSTAIDEIAQAAETGLTVYSGLHHLIGDDPRLVELARRHQGRLVDIRRPRPAGELRFWNGEIFEVFAPRVAVLGTDCAVGKRTTCKMLLEACRADGLATEMIYTGQTGWMEGYPHGIILDALPNDFVSGELEGAIVACYRELEPQLILIEGQSSLRNPSGPCGSELLISAGTTGVILQHAPGRECFIDFEELDCRIPDVAEEIALVRAYGAETLAVCLNGEGLEPEELIAEQKRLTERLGIPVVRPLEEGVGALVPVLRRHVEAGPGSSHSSSA